MEVVILFILFVVYIVLKLKDYFRDTKFSIEPPQPAEWLRYCDDDLEAKIEARINDPGERDQLWEEVSWVLSRLEDWQLFDRNEFDKHRRHPQTGAPAYWYHDLTLDILLTNKGKISRRVAFSGRRSWCSRWEKTQSNSIMDYQLARWFNTRMSNFNSSLQLVRIPDGVLGSEFAWTGMPAANRGGSYVQKEPIPRYTQSWGGYYFDIFGARRRKIEEKIEKNLKWSIEKAEYEYPDFLEKYCDIELEKKLRVDILDDTTRPEILDKAGSVLSTLKSWKDYDMQGNGWNDGNGWGLSSWKLKNEVILDILMAYYGKIPHDRGLSLTGYPHDGSEMVEELLRWILNQLRQSGNDAVLMKYAGNMSVIYFWLGTRPSLMTESVAVEP